MNWKIPNSCYLDYLRKTEDRIPYTNYGNRKFKPFFGELFRIDEIIYLTQVSHAQERHRKLHNDLDFYKLYDNKGKLISVVNLNYMFPIHESLAIDLKYKEIGLYRDFDTDDEKGNYIVLLRRELKSITDLELDKRAKELYDLKTIDPEHKVSKRCFDFKQLEVFCLEYMKADNR